MTLSAEYHAYIASPTWQIKRLAVLERDSYRCRVCDSSERLDVHHRTYKRFGDEPLDDLTTLCRDCHERHHAAKRGQKAPKRKKARAKKSKQVKGKIAALEVENERLHRVQRANKMKQQAVRDGIVSPSLRAELVARARH